MDAHAEWLETWRQWAIVIGLAVICVLFFVASKWVLRCIASLHPDLRGFLALALWFALFVLGLFATAITSPSEFTSCSEPSAS
jgi:hypothetical protein